ncbi:MAG TPA: SGNH/GDSL hydrolase family protein [Gaiellaceae bacterium]|nr:SGNH/GDSL hydrolase family protein [Gaiellaceae bacterium]
MTALSTFAFGPSERVVLVGDSLVKGGISGVTGLSVSWNVPLKTMIDSAFTGTQNCRCFDAGRPLLWDNQGVSSTDLSYWVAAAPAAVLGKGATVCMFAVGVNDATNGVTAAQARGRLDAIIGNLWASEPGIRFIVLDAMENGELWPDGAGPHDAAIDQVNIGLSQACDDLSPSGVITYLPTRAWWFTQIPSYNPTNTNGNFTLTVDNLHLNGLGAKLQAAYMWSKRG